MGAALKFSGRTLHRATIIIFSTVWEILLREWHGMRWRTHTFIGAGLAMLVLSTLVVGCGNDLGSAALTPVGLLCDSADNPLGIDSTPPRRSCKTRNVVSKIFLPRLPLSAGRAERA